MEFVLPPKLTQAPPARTLIIPSISSTAGLLLSSDHLAHLARKAASAELGGSLLLVAPKPPVPSGMTRIFEGLPSSRDSGPPGCGVLFPGVGFDSPSEDKVALSFYRSTRIRSGIGTRYG